jgi:hypothetical protein
MAESSRRPIAIYPHLVVVWSPGVGDGVGWMAVVLWLLAVGLLIISVLFDGDPTSTWSQLLAVAASWAGPILLVLALVFSVRTWLTKLLRRQIVETSLAPQ